MAAGLGIDRLGGWPVAVPLTHFLGPVGQLKAHLYASFHSSRAGEAEYGPPVSRATITVVSGVPERTQRAYDRRLGLRPRPNIALGPVIVPGAPGEEKTAVSPAWSALGQELAWRSGRACFTFTDRRGRCGRPGQRYHAWRLPNSYPALHPCLPRGRQRRVNRQLADLRITRDTGNGRAAVRPDRCFFQQAGGAGRAWSRKWVATAYWPHLVSRQHCWQVWAVLSSMEAG